jgi:hypothetical protein|tara:strand:- start:382 stop:849 length:468 start_codon:yes stop_codon:yes gene_type:complete
MLLNDVNLSWVKLDPKNPDMGYDKQSPQYSVTVKTTDKVQAETWKKAGLNIKPVEENGAIAYTVGLKKKIYSDADGRSNTSPPPVVDKSLQPILDTSNIGNGSKGNVQIKFKPYEYMGKKGISTQLLALQITDIVEYQNADKLEFAAIDTDKDVI